MLQISQDAKLVLKEALEEGEAESGRLYRLVLSGDALALSLAGVEEGDTVYEMDGVPVLAAPAELADQLEGTIAVEQTPEGTRFIIDS